MKKVFIVRMKKLCTLPFQSVFSENSNLYLRWEHMSESTVSDVTADFIFLVSRYVSRRSNRSHKGHCW